MRVKYLLPCCCICDSLQLDMQHDHVLKKLKFDPKFRGRVVDPRFREGVGGLICNMTMF